MNGILIIDKPEGRTSHDVVQAIRKRFKTSKVGHLGTLDPMATGVLPICIGKATRMARFLPGSPKEYEGEIRFGFSTNTYDREGTPTSEEKPFDADPVKVGEAMENLRGVFDQVPPPFSAKKVGGVPSHKLARRDQAIELQAVRVAVERFEVLALEPPRMRFRVVCSPGTYVRSLAHDLGQRLGCGAHLTALRRTRSGEFDISQAVPLDKVSEANVIPMERMLECWPRIEVSESDESKVMRGNQIPGAADGQFARIFNKKGQFLALASVENGWVRPRLVLTSITSN
jgi:tRNA pseudouridine55 synthase